MTEPEAPASPIAWGPFLRTYGAVIAAVALLIGSVTPWATFGPFSYAGTHGDGVLTLILGVLALIILLVGVVPERLRAIGAALCGVVSVLITGYDGVHISSVAPGPGVSVGWGLILALLAAIALSVITLARVIHARPRFTRHSAPPAPPAPEPAPAPAPAPENPSPAEPPSPPPHLW